MCSLYSILFQDPLITFINSNGKKSGSLKWTGKEILIGLLAWLMIVVAAMTIFFRLLETGGYDPVLILYAIELIIGLSAAAAANVSTIFNTRINLVGESKSVAYGILGGIGLIGMQIVIGLTQAITQDFDIVSIFAGELLSVNIGRELVLLAAVAEELFFRFMIYGTLRRTAPEVYWLFAAIPSSIIFAGYHFFVLNLGDISALIGTIIIFFAGIILSYLFELTQNIATPMIAHLINNGYTQISWLTDMIGMYWYIIIVPVFLIIIWLICSSRGGRR